MRYLITDPGVNGLLAGFKSGEQLCLYGCRLLTKLSLRSVARHQSLTSLTLSGWSVRNWRALTGSTSLTCLDLSIPVNSMAISESVVCTAVSQSPHLVSLRLTGLLTVASSALRAIAELSQLSTLALGGCRGIEDQDLCRLADGVCSLSLRRLLLPHSAPLQTETVRVLASSCGLLEFVDLSGAAATPMVVMSSMRLLETLVWKGIPKESNGSLWVAGLSHLSRLKWLDLSGSLVNSDDVVALSELPALEHLTLCGRHPSGELVSHRKTEIESDRENRARD